MAAVSSRVGPGARRAPADGMRLSQAGAPAFPGQGHRHAVEDHWCERIGWMRAWASDGYPQMTQMDADRDGRAGSLFGTFVFFGRPTPRREHRGHRRGRGWGADEIAPSFFYSRGARDAGARTLGA